METSRIALVVIILLLITGGIMLYNNNGTNRNLFANIPAIPQVGEGGGPQSPSVSPSTQIYSGEIISVSFSLLQYKGAIPVTIHENGMPLDLYVTTDTTIYTNDSKLVPRAYLREGMNIQAKGTPVEGGIEVSEIRIQTTADMSENNEPTVTTSPTPIVEVVSPTITTAPTSTVGPSISP